MLHKYCFKDFTAELSCAMDKHSALISDQLKRLGVASIEPVLHLVAAYLLRRNHSAVVLITADNYRQL